MFCTTIEIHNKSIEIAVSGSKSSDASVDNKLFDDGSWEEAEESVDELSSTCGFQTDVKDYETDVSYSSVTKTVTADESVFSLSLDDPSDSKSCTLLSEREDYSISPTTRPLTDRCYSNDKSELGWDSSNTSNHILLMLEELEIPMTELYVENLMKIRKTGTSPTTSIFSDDDMNEVDSISTLSQNLSLSDVEEDKPRRSASQKEKLEVANANMHEDSKKAQTARSPQSEASGDTPRYVQLYELAKKRKSARSRDQYREKKTVQKSKEEDFGVPPNIMRLYEYGKHKNKERKFMCQENLRSGCRRTATTSVAAKEASDRLYQLSRLQQQDGKKRRELIKRKKVNLNHGKGLNAKKISISKATHLYYRGIEHLKTLEKKQKEAAMRMDLPFKPRFVSN